MKKVSKNLIKSLVGFSLAMSITGCGDTEDLFSLDSSSGGGSDSLKLVKTSGGNFNIEWNKKYSGYSEAVYKEDGSSSKRGRYFLTSNSKVNYVLECSILEQNENEVVYGCQNTNQNVAPSQKSARFNFKTNKVYTFYSSEGFDHSLKKAGTIQYDSANTSISIK